MEWTKNRYRERCTDSKGTNGRLIKVMPDFNWIIKKTSKQLSYFSKANDYSPYPPRVTPPKKLGELGPLNRDKAWIRGQKLCVISIKMIARAVPLDKQGNSGRI